MWYEALVPSVTIIFAAMAGTPFLSYLANKLLLGNPYRRSLRTESELDQYLRDMRLTGNPYKLQGLDSIPDE